MTLKVLTFCLFFLLFIPCVLWMELNKAGALFFLFAIGLNLLVILFQNPFSDVSPWILFQIIGTLVLGSLVLHSGSLALQQIIFIQTPDPRHWFLIREPLACLIFCVGFFGLPEAKSRETSSQLLPIAEKINRVVILVFFVVFFLGGPHIPLIPTNWLQENVNTLFYSGLLLLGIVFVVLGLVISYPALKSDSSRKRHSASLVWGGLVCLTGATLLVLAAVMGKGPLGTQGSATVISIFYLIILTVKTICVLGLVTWIRRSQPTLRKDQWVRLGWCVGVPLVIVNSLITVLRVYF